MRVISQMEGNFKKERKMTSKRKIAISISAICVIILAAVIVGVSVWAARNASFGGDFDGGYTAYHVDAQITGEYKVGATVTDAEGWIDMTTTDTEPANTIVFTSAQSTGSATASFNSISDIVLKSTDNVIFKYVITNTSETSTDFTVVGTQSGTFTNLNVTYQTSATGTGEDAQTLNASDNTTDAFTVEAGSSVTVYVTLSIADADQNASFDGAVNWTLTAVEEQA